MNITSNNTMIFAKQFEGKTHYRAGLSTKKTDGTYEKAYIDVRFPKGIELADRTKVNITKGFLTFYKNKEGKDIFYIVVQEYKTETEVQQSNTTDEYEKFGSSITVEELDQLELPF